MFSWINFLTYALITGSSPGPNNITSMTNGSRLGFRKAMPYNLGILAGFCLVMLLCTMLSRALHAVLPVVKLPMLVLGAGYILYLAWKTVNSTGVKEEARVQAGFLPGFLFQFINPHLYLYCILSMEAYIMPYFQGNAWALVGFSLVLVAIGFGFTLCWTLFGSLFKLLFFKYSRLTNAIMSLLLVYCAISLFR